MSQPGGETGFFPANPYRVDKLGEGQEPNIDGGIKDEQTCEMQSASEGDIEDNTSDR